MALRYAKCMTVLGFAGAMALAASGPVAAQDNEDEVQEFEAFEVTGSRIKRSDFEGPAPVRVIGRQDIDNEGFVSVQDVLDSLVENTGGGFDQSFTFGFTPGAAGINLRAFGSGRTLILVDGRRLPVYPIGLGGTSSFVDLASIPVAQIERIEILKDGASAIYGSDAVAGVINVITRKDIQGSTFQVRLGDTDEGGFESQRFQFLVGNVTSDLSTSFTAEYYDNEALQASDRDYSRFDNNPNVNGSSFSIGGSTFYTFGNADPNDDFITIQDPNCGTPQDSLGGRGQPNVAAGVVTGNEVWCGFNRAEFRQLIPEITRGSAAFRLERRFDGFEGFFRGSYYRSETASTLEPNFYGGNLFSGAVADPIVANNGGGFVAAGASNNPTTGTGDERSGFFVRRLVEFGPRANNITSSASNFVGGFKGIAGQFDWEAAFSFAESIVQNLRANILRSGFDNEVSNNGLDLFQPIPQDIVDKYTFTSVTDAKSRIQTVDASLTGPTGLVLPGGGLSFALAVDADRQSYVDARDNLTLAGDAFDGAAAGGGDRERYGIGVEFLMPVIDQLEISLAGRFDQYNDDSNTDGAFSPKIGIAYRPLDWTLFRATFAESFRAPDLQRLFGANTRGFSSVIDTPLCLANGGFGPGDTSVPACTNVVQSVAINLGSNIGLEEEEGESFSIGMVLEPIDNLSFTLDYYDIKLDNIVNAPSAQFILNQCGFFGNLCGNITRAPDGTLQTGGLISATALNLSSQQIDGIDFDGEYTFSVDGIGKFRFNTVAAWVHQLTTQFDAASPEVQNIGLAVLPRWRAAQVMDWSFGSSALTVRVDWVDELPGVNASNPVQDSQLIDSYTTVNTVFRHNLGGIGKIALGINNIFGEEYPIDPTQGNNQFTSGQTGFADPLGRNFFVQYDVSF